MTNTFTQHIEELCDAEVKSQDNLPLANSVINLENELQSLYKVGPFNESDESTYNTRRFQLDMLKNRISLIKIRNQTDENSEEFKKLGRWTWEEFLSFFASALLTAGLLVWNSYLLQAVINSANKSTLVTLFAALFSMFLLVAAVVTIVAICVHSKLFIPRYRSYEVLNDKAVGLVYGGAIGVSENILLSQDDFLKNMHNDVEMREYFSNYAYFEKPASENEYSDLSVYLSKHGICDAVEKLKRINESMNSTNNKVKFDKCLKMLSDSILIDRYPKISFCKRDVNISSSIAKVSEVKDKSRALAVLSEVTNSALSLMLSGGEKDKVGISNKYLGLFPSLCDVNFIEDVYSRIYDFHKSITTMDYRVLDLSSTSQTRELRAQSEKALNEQSKLISLMRISDYLENFKTPEGASAQFMMFYENKNSDFCILNRKENEDILSPFDHIINNMPEGESRKNVEELRGCFNELYRKQMELYSSIASEIQADIARVIDPISKIVDISALRNFQKDKVRDLMKLSALRTQRIVNKDFKVANDASFIKSDEMSAKFEHSPSYKRLISECPRFFTGVESRGLDIEKHMCETLIYRPRINRDSKDKVTRTRDFSLFFSEAEKAVHWGHDWKLKNYFSLDRSSFNDAEIPRRLEILKNSCRSPSNTTQEKEKRIDEFTGWYNKGNHIKSDNNALVGFIDCITDIAKSGIVDYGCVELVGDTRASAIDNNRSR